MKNAMQINIRAIAGAMNKASMMPPKKYIG
jgi:hypothetical protein